MNSSASLAIAELREWIGRVDKAHDEITPRLVRELNATLDIHNEESTPLAIHWCLAPVAAPSSRVGRDGHPQRGGFLPPVALPRRMWAGGQLTFHDRLLPGDRVERKSKIADVTMKEGRTGALCFVAVDHEISTPRGLAITERQDIVYRDLLAPAPGAKSLRPTELPKPTWQRSMRPDTILLFRYSSLTFNGHRIHYDRDYAMNQEYYPGLVVHGPLQATLLIGFAEAILGRAPVQFSFRGVSPLFDFQSFTLGAVEQEGELKLWIVNEDGVQTMDANAQ